MEMHSAISVLGWQERAPLARIRRGSDTYVHALPTYTLFMADVSGAGMSTYFPTLTSTRSEAAEVLNSAQIRMELGLCYCICCRFSSLVLASLVFSPLFYVMMTMSWAYQATHLQYWKGFITNLCLRHLLYVWISIWDNAQT
eukprot:g61434.t1